MGKEGIVHPNNLNGVKYCADCGLIFHIIKSINRIYIYFEWDTDRCRYCYSIVKAPEEACSKCGYYLNATEFPCMLTITCGLADMILDSRRCWDEFWYNNHPLPIKPIGDHNVGYMMGIMFGFNKNFKMFGLGSDGINLASVKYGEVWAMRARDDVV
jgi:hypothetical protein